jgi:hypothetical protein
MVPSESDLAGWFVGMPSTHTLNGLLFELKHTRPGWTVTEKVSHLHTPMTFLRPAAHEEYSQEVCVDATDHGQVSHGSR